ncbi:MAG TPA: dienelactone hydrolase family protein [Candidatus Binatia bacterium]|nr:dienelactone hydrolase family protein [Candidatus Binatia bacterium]
MTISKWQETNIDGSAMRLHVSAPDGRGPYPGLVVMQHQGGVDEFIQHMTRRLAEAGFVAAAPDLYHRDGPDCKDDIVARRSRLSDRRIIIDIAAAVDFLRAHESVAGDRIGIIGFCMGGRLALLGAATNSHFKAAAAFYPGNAFRAWGRDLPSPFERIADIQCPVQGHFGAEDANPSPEDMARLDAELKKFNKPHEFYTYAGAGHGFMDGTKESYRRAADEAAWPQTLDFLGRQLNAI